MTAPTPTLPDAVLPVSKSPSSLGLWGRRLGQSPLNVFPIALGSSTFGGSIDARAAAEVIERFTDLGGNFVDASGSHPDAGGEQILGSWLARRGRRSNILIGTTIGRHQDLSENPTPVIVRAVDASLARLGVGHLDLLSIQLDRDSPADEVLVAVDDLVRAGKVRHAAAAAPTADQLIEARVLAAQAGVAPLVAAQGNYSLVHREEYEPEVARIATLQGIGFMPRQPLAGGLLAGGQHTRQDVSRLRGLGVSVSLPAKRWALLVETVAAVADELGVTAPAVALAWLLSRPNVTAPIVSASTPGQVEQAMAAVRIQLTRHQAAELDRLSSRLSRSSL